MALFGITHYDVILLLPNFLVIQKKKISRTHHTEPPQVQKSNFKKSYLLVIPELQHKTSQPVGLVKKSSQRLSAMLQTSPLAPIFC